jgi:hypothetical protein
MRAQDAVQFVEGEGEAGMPASRRVQMWYVFSGEKPLKHTDE